jgi:pimeloyl-ACP methyl ester carboxylesterase
MRRTAHGIPGSEYVQLDPGTHMMPLEQPDALAAALGRFRIRFSRESADSGRTHRNGKA